MTDSSKDSGATDARVAEAIQRAKVQLEHMIDLNPECMVLVDQDGQVLRANRAFLELLHEGQFQSVLGSPLANLFPSVERAFFTSLLANKTNHSWFEKNEKMAEGGERRLQFGVLSGGASSEALVVIVHDVTRDQEKSALLEKGFKVEAVQALMGALMHHLNQPLTVVMIRALRSSFDKHPFGSCRRLGDSARRGWPGTRASCLGTVQGRSRTGPL
jgi:nitrogen-specific signal transduction histidine kinase